MFFNIIVSQPASYITSGAHYESTQQWDAQDLKAADIAYAAAAKVKEHNCLTPIMFSEPLNVLFKNLLRPSATTGMPYATSLQCALEQAEQHALMMCLCTAAKQLRTS